MIGSWGTINSSLAPPSYSRSRSEWQLLVCLTDFRRPRQFPAARACIISQTTFFIRSSPCQKHWNVNYRGQGIKNCSFEAEIVAGACLNIVLLIFSSFQLALNGGDKRVQHDIGCLTNCATWKETFYAAFQWFVHEENPFHVNWKPCSFESVSIFISIEFLDNFLHSRKLHVDLEYMPAKSHSHPWLSISNYRTSMIKLIISESGFNLARICKRPVFELYSLLLVRPPCKPHCICDLYHSEPRSPMVNA